MVNRRQKQQERKKAKRKQKKQLLQRQQSPLARFRQASTQPIYESLVLDDLQERRAGYALLSRNLSATEIACSLFMLDLDCLGVKNCAYYIRSLAEYRKITDEMREQFEFRSVSPGEVRGLVEACVTYANDIGFNPHSDYRHASLLFGDIEPEFDDGEWEFGQDGKPHFCSGPFDTPEKCQRILATLRASCGEGNFHFTTPTEMPGLHVEGTPEDALPLSELDD